MFRTLLLISVLASNSLVLSGCSQKFQDVNSTIAEYWKSGDDIELSSEEIAALPYSSAYFKFGEQGQIFMVLAFAETNLRTGLQQLKWMSSDRVMVVTENGRIVQTLQLPNENLVSLQYDYPEFKKIDKNITQEWDSTYDWQPDYRFGYSAKTTRNHIGSEMVVTPLTTIQTDKFSETTYFTALDQSIQNEFWVDESGRVVKSVQFLGPEMTKVELTILKDFKG